MKGMQKMQSRLTVNALGFTIALLAISACSPPAREINISATPVEKPELVLPKSDKLNSRDVEWTVLTPENFQEVVSKLSAKGKPLVFFALTDEGYQALALNLNDLRGFIQQQQAIIVAYEGYYKDSNSALEAANNEIEKIKLEANAANNGSL
jgi:hypothetical protein